MVPIRPKPPAFPAPSATGRPVIIEADVIEYLVKASLEQRWRILSRVAMETMWSGEDSQVSQLTPPSAAPLASATPPASAAAPASAAPPASTAAPASVASLASVAPPPVVVERPVTQAPPPPPPVTQAPPPAAPVTQAPPAPPPVAARKQLELVEAEESAEREAVPPPPAARATEAPPRPSPTPPPPRSTMSPPRPTAAPAAVAVAAPAPAPVAAPAPAPAPASASPSLPDQSEQIFQAMAELTMLEDGLAGARFALEAALRAVPCLAGLVHLRDQTTRELVVVDAKGPRAEQLLKTRTKSDPLVTRAARTGKPTVVTYGAEPGAEQTVCPRHALFDPWSVVLVPIVHGGQLLGLLEMIDPIDGKPHDEAAQGALAYVAMRLGGFLAEHGTGVGEPA